MATVNIDEKNIGVNETDEAVVLRGMLRGLMSVFERMKVGREKGMLYGVVTAQDEETIGQTIHFVGRAAQAATNAAETKRIVENRELHELREKVARKRRA